RLRLAALRRHRRPPRRLPASERGVGRRRRADDRDRHARALVPAALTGPPMPRVGRAALLLLVLAGASCSHAPGGAAADAPDCVATTPACTSCSRRTATSIPCTTRASA